MSTSQFWVPIVCFWLEENLMEDVRFYKEQTEVLISLNTAESSCFDYSSDSTPTRLCNPLPPLQGFGCQHTSKLWHYAPGMSLLWKAAAGRAVGSLVESFCPLDAAAAFKHIEAQALGIGPCLSCALGMSVLDHGSHWSWPWLADMTIPSRRRLQ